MQRVKTQRRLLWVLALLLLLVVPTSVALAAPSAQREVDDDNVVYGDVVLFDEDFELNEDGRVNGDIVLFNGTATISGTVNGDVVLFNGDLHMSETAVLNGDCVLFNGASTGDGSVSCTNLNVEIPVQLENFLSDLEFNPGPMVEVEIEEPPLLQRILGGTAAAIARSVLFGLLAFAAASLIPQPMQRIENTLRTRPIASGAIGLLTTFSMPFVAVTLALISIPLILLCGLGLLGYPLIGVMILAMVAAGFLGWFTVGNIVGGFLARRLNMNVRNRAITTALGTAAITFGIGFLGAIPFVIGESLIWLLIVFLGLGATALTKFGTREYPLVAAPAPLNQDKITAVLDTLPDKENLAE
ncbi:polymer-forming cytoskeletal protein [Candidatus Leptofilum sp.]|uniref:polymer-forming cytoskeletal protein n=1 Tax=Candidatus Leptofilum sp. TaxID=3241576 RepID=UPI003B5918CA